MALVNLSRRLLDLPVPGSPKPSETLELGRFISVDVMLSSMNDKELLFSGPFTCNGQPTMMAYPIPRGSTVIATPSVRGVPFSPPPPLPMIQQAPGGFNPDAKPFVPMSPDTAMAASKSGKAFTVPEIRTRDGLVRCVNATDVLCAPHWILKSEK